MKHPFYRLIKSCGAVSVIALSLFGCDANEDFQEMSNEISTAKAPAANARTTSARNADLALHWAPIHRQDTDVTGRYALNGQSDYITAIDFDGDWVATNNWDNTIEAPLAAHAYYSVVETGTHWFILYAFFHPRDWTDIFFLYGLDQHENDLEGVLFAVKKDGSPYGSLHGAITVSHKDFFSYTPNNSPLQANQETIDGTLSFENGHPLTAQEAKGHGLKAWPYYDINGDGIKYYPTAASAEVPDDPDDRHVNYRLVDIFARGGLWDQRNNADLFESYGDFAGTIGSGGANAPWAWNDGDDEPDRGELATDPARVFDSYFKNFGELDLNYVHNRYRGIP